VNRSSILKLHLCLTLAAGFLLAACNEDTAQTARTQEKRALLIRVTGEVHSANSRNFGAPSVHNIWQYTIAYMAPDGNKVSKGEEIVRFDTQELKTRIRDKGNALNEKEKQLQKQEILTRERLAELRLLVEQARADVDKALLKADIPEILLANRDYREYKLLLKQARLTRALREAEVEKEVVILATESKILKREIVVLQAEIEELQGSVDSMTIRAPAEGVVIHSLDRHGNKMAVGDNIWGGRRVVEFPDLAHLELRLEIPERDSARVAIGHPVSFSMDAVPDQVFHGEITELASVVHTRSINQPARVFDATVALLDPDPELMRPGMSVNAEIQVAGAVEHGP
jgi:HlyD family secretion protein